MAYPKAWTEITIGTYIDLHRAISIPIEGEQQGISREINIVAAVTGKGLSDIKAMSIPEFKEAISALAWIADTSVLENIPLPSTIKLEGVTYDVCTDLAKITAAQFIDLSHFTKDPKAIVDNMHNILAVLLVPHNKKYDGENHKALAQLFYDKMPVAVAYPVSVFFCKVLQHSQKVMVRCSAKEVGRLKKMERKLKRRAKSLLNAGVGTPP